MSTVLDICNAIGRRQLASALRVSASAISNAVTDEVFPPGWYAVVKRECDALGIDCPLGLFNFKAASDESAA